MRLKKLILHGFKSFADRTEFVFDAPITGIVGPNGCGKSNVVDGFKWVLGEQSAKSLRGEAMLDVIFNGSGNRKPAGMSEVTLVFENPRRADGTRTLNIDVDEVSVGRRLFRDGTSEYQLNNQTARLKDIRELFLDTGVGVDAYSVIEQGRVAALLEANPEERRIIFEEAAGISKFKAKKKESQRKLEKVDQNLLRVTDIVEEVEKRLRSVRIQAGRARTFQEYSTRLSDLRLTYSLHEYHTLFTQLKELESGAEDAKFRLDDVSGDLMRSQNQLATKREELESLAQSKQRAEHELVQARADAEAARQRQQFANEQLSQIAEQIAAFERDRDETSQKLDEARSALESERAELSRLTEELEAKTREIDHRQEAFREGQLQLNNLVRENEDAKATILELMRKLATISNQISAIEFERKNVAAQQEKLVQRRQVVVGEIETLDAKRAEVQTKLDDAVAQLEMQQAQMNAKRDAATALGKQIASISQNLGAAKEHRSGLLSRQKLLQDLEARREGMSEGVKAVLRQRDDKFSFIRGLVADVLRVDVEHAQVIEAALNGQDQTLLCDRQADALASPVLDELSGRINVLFSDELSCDAGASYNWNLHPHRIRLAIDLVRFDDSDAIIARHLLGKTIVVENLDIAHELHKTAPAGFRFVTRKAEVLESDGTLRAGPLTAAMGILSRRSELDSIALQIAEVDRRISSLSEELSHNNAQAKAVEDETNVLRSDIYQTNTAKVELTSQLAQHDDRLATLRREQPLIDRELSTLMAQIERLSNHDEQLLAERSQMESKQAGLQRQVDDSSTKQSQITEDLKHVQEQLTACRVALGQVQEKQFASQQHVQRHAAMIEELGQQIERLDESVRTVSSRRGSVEAELQNAKRQELALQEKHEQLQQHAVELEQKVSEAQQSAQALEATVNRAREQHAEIEQKLHEIQLHLSESRVRRDTLVQRTLEELQLDLPTRYETDGYQPSETNWDAIGEEIKELREKIHRLGNVNLDAIGEMDELEQRAKFLQDQFNDLTNSKKQLEELIDQINIESSLRFEQTFNAVREHFQGMFRKLFGGGKADIFLETEVEDNETPQAPTLGPDGATVLPIMKKKIDPLDAGIEIIAKPPGKQPVNISQLSGGEKTMTCVALLMSIFKSKPSPFCILDEVDAALDEANNERFNLIVQEFLEQSQFIIITHSKRTMTIADVLYGVTMQEQGVSKRVAVKFDQVQQDGHIDHAVVAEPTAA